MTYPAVDHFHLNSDARGLLQEGIEGEDNWDDEYKTALTAMVALIDDEDELDYPAEEDEEELGSLNITEISATDYERFVELAPQIVMMTTTYFGVDDRLTGHDAESYR